MRPAFECNGSFGLLPGPLVSEKETDEPENGTEEEEAPVHESDEDNEGAFTRDWIEQMTASVSNIVNRPNDVTDAIFEVQETSLAIQTPDSGNCRYWRRIARQGRKQMPHKPLQSHGEQ